MISENLLKQFLPLSETERFLKKVYDMKHLYPSAARLRDVLLRMNIRQMQSFWIPAINEGQDSFRVQSLTCNLVGLDQLLVSVVPHVRYQQYSLHRNEFYDCMIQVSGEMHVILEGKNFLLKQGDICLIPPYVSYMVGAFRDDSVMLNIVARADYGLPAFFQTLFSGKDVDYLLFRDVQEENITFFLDQIASISLTEPFRPASDSMLAPLFEAVLQCLAFWARRIPERFTVSRSNYSRPKVIGDILFMIQEQYRDLSLAALSERVGYTPSHLSRLIRKYTGISFTELLTRVRIAQGCLFLFDPDIPVSDIPEKIGYESMLYFSRLFRKYTGQTPLCFRREIRRQGLLPEAVAFGTESGSAIFLD